MTADADMTAGLADQLDLAPELRIACYSFGEEFGYPPTVVWRVPGAVTLLASSTFETSASGILASGTSASGTGARLTVEAPWGVIAVAAPRDDDILELAVMERPGERTRTTVADAVAGRGPSWAGRGLDGARTGAALLVSSELPPGTGVGAGEATETTIRRSLDACAAGLSGVTDARTPAVSGVTDAEPGADGAYASLGSTRLPLDLATAGFRLVVIDTRVRVDAQDPGDSRDPGHTAPAGGERSPLDVAAAALKAGDLETFGALLTAAHHATSPDSTAYPGSPRDPRHPTHPDSRRATYPDPHRAAYRDWPGGEEQDLAVAAALRAGAVGARAITDGPGRPALALVPVSRLPGLRAEISSAFAARGLRAPRLLTFTPASPLTFTPQ
jgi:galactokinase